jgi:hypothetical protein
MVGSLANNFSTKDNEQFLLEHNLQKGAQRFRQSAASAAITEPSSAQQ